MLYLVKTTNLTIKSTSLLCCLMFAAALALLPASAVAQCANWDASGVWDIDQRGQPVYLRLTLAQKGRVLTGKAVHSAKTGWTEHRAVTGTVDGTINGDSFSVQIFWPGGLTGIYNGKVLPSGRIDGETFDKNNSKIRQTWHSVGVLKCAPPVKSSAIPQYKPPQFKPIPSSGKVPASEPAAPKPKLEPPYIFASAVIFPSPGSPGVVVITWDAGPDHPYAEVWFKVNNGDDAFLVEQGKGGRQVTVERGKLYEYILTDDGKTLASVNVLVPRR